MGLANPVFHREIKQNDTTEANNLSMNCDRPSGTQYCFEDVLAELDAAIAKLGNHGMAIPHGPVLMNVVPSGIPATPKVYWPAMNVYSHSKTFSGTGALYRNTVTENTAGVSLVDGQCIWGYLNESALAITMQNKCEPLVSNNNAMINTGTMTLGLKPTSTYEVPFLFMSRVAKPILSSNVGPLITHGLAHFPILWGNSALANSAATTTVNFSSGTYPTMSVPSPDYSIWLMPTGATANAFWARNPRVTTKGFTGATPVGFIITQDSVAGTEAFTWFLIP